MKTLLPNCADVKKKSLNNLEPENDSMLIFG